MNLVVARNANKTFLWWNFQMLTKWAIFRVIFSMKVASFDERNDGNAHIIAIQIYTRIQI